MAVSEELVVNLAFSNTSSITANINLDGLVTVNVMNNAIDAHNASLTAHADLYNLWKPNTEYAVGDIRYSPKLPSWAYLECTQAGVSGTDESIFTNISTGGGVISDGGVIWAVRDLRQGTSIGRMPALIDVGSGVAGLPAVDGSLLTGVVSSGGSGLNQWIKCADGTMLQRGASATSDFGVNPATANVTFPLSFYSTNYVIIGIHQSGSAPLIVGEKNGTKTASGIALWLQRNDGAVPPSPGWIANYIAVGRWKA